jgi:arylsulfatase A-like enzyme/Tfp pilus assembly protein PilF
MITTRRRITIAALLLALASFGLAGCQRTSARRPNADLAPGALRGANVLLVTIDTLRADRVGAYGGGTLTPTLDGLASRGLRFARAYSHAPMTLPAHASILTGLVPATHGVHLNGSTALGPGPTTISELLGRNGYRTAAFVGAFVLDARFGLNRGFDVYDDHVGTEQGPVNFGFAERSADRVTAAAADWLFQPERSSTPWFAWIHLFDPHAPYRAPVQLAANPYDNEVAYTDRQLGQLLQRLEGSGMLAHTLVIVLADHGESLGEHGEETHGLFAYEPTLHIPLLIAGPAIRADVISAPVAQADLLPTVADLLGIGAPPSLDGKSLVPTIRGAAGGDAVIYFEALDANLSRNWAPLTGVVAGDWKYIDLPLAELYNVADDPHETANRAGAETQRVAAMTRLLEPWSSRHGVAAPAKVDSQAAARLRSLGYVAADGATIKKAHYGIDDDPKRLAYLDREYERALQLTGEGQHAEAIALFKEVLAKRSDFAAAYLTLASVYIEDERAAEAIALLTEAERRGMASPKLSERLGEAYLASGDRRRAIAVIEPAVKSSGSVDALNTLGIAYAESGASDAARAAFTRALAAAPAAATIWNNLGLLELSAKRTSAAAAAFEHAVAADPAFAPAWRGLGAARASLSDLEGAATAWTRATALSPQDYDTLFNLVMVLVQSGHREQARPHLERFIRDAPPARYAADIARLKALAGQ